MWWKVLFLSAWCVVGGGGCRPEISLQTAAPTRAPLWEDGSYLGVHDVFTPQLIRVAVDITGGRIMTIRVLQPPAWGAPQEQDELLRLVVESQTTVGHVPPGTGNAHEQLLRAIDDALRQAQPRTPLVP